MKNKILFLGSLALPFGFMQANAQSTSANELEVINQLSSNAAVSSKPVSQLLNAPGNEALKAFFFTPVKNKTALKGRKMAVLAADGFEETELTARRPMPGSTTMAMGTTGR